MKWISPLPRFNYAQHLNRYWHELRKTGSHISNSLYEEYEKLGKEIADYSERTALCHHDPNPGNIIHADGTLYLLDWEYAGHGWPGFDAAALSCEWDMKTDETCELMIMFYRHLCAVWALLNEANHQGPGQK